MSQIILDGLLLERLIDAKFSGGTDDLIAHWDESGSGLDPSTIYRWKQGQLPRTGPHLLRLSSLLDVDPFCLLTFDRGSSQAAVDLILSWAQSNKWRRFAFFRDFFGRQREWPPSLMAREYFGRDWCQESFFHDPLFRSNYYPAIHIKIGRKHHAVFPQTFHFAFRQAEQYAGRWLSYGFVVVQGSTVKLQHINGQQSSCISDNEAYACVETFFGPAPAEFKVASLHPFNLEIDLTREGSGSCVRFQG